MNQYSFSTSRYLIHAWYKYILIWLSVTGIVSLIMGVNGTLSPLYVLIFALFFFVITLLVFINKVKSWKKSKVKIDGERVEFVHVIQDGYEADIALGKRKKVKTYVVFKPAVIDYSGKAITLRGNVICAEEKFDSGIHKRKEYSVQSFTIPPYFANWNAALDQLKVSGRG